MCVAALRDLGVPEDVFSGALAALGLGDELHGHFSRDQREGVSGWRFHVHSHTTQHSQGEHHHGHDHTHHHGEGFPHVHGRSHREIRELVNSSTLADPVKERVLAVFRRIAEAEGRIHGVPSDDVGFHEVGAADSIADIVAACAGIAALGVEQIVSSPLVEGRGTINCAHGQFPLPAPATLEILKGIPFRQIDESKELITPTGAALLAEYAMSFGPQPEMTIAAVGYGVGTRHTPPRPNVLRAIIGEAVATPTRQSEVLQLEANLDDCTPEVLASCSEKLISAGALDVWTVPAMMKKGRSGFVLSVLCGSDAQKALVDIIFRHTTTFGVRMSLLDREVLEREWLSVETEFGAVQVKVGRRAGIILQAQPEYSSCAEIASRQDCPIRSVFDAAKASALAQLANANPGPEVP